MKNYLRINLQLFAVKKKEVDDDPDLEDEEIENDPEDTSATDPKVRKQKSQANLTTDQKLDGILSAITKLIPQIEITKGTKEVPFPKLPIQNKDTKDPLEDETIKKDGIWEWLKKVW